MAKKSSETMSVSGSDIKQIVQSYLLTTARRNLSVMHERILISLAEAAQRDIAGLDFRHGTSMKPVEPSLNYPSMIAKTEDMVTIAIPTRNIMMDENGNYSYVRKKAIEITKVGFYVEKRILDRNGNQAMTKNGQPMVQWEYIPLATAASGRTDSTSSFLFFRVDKRIWEVMLDFSKGFRAYYPEIARRLNSQYSIRLYTLLSRQEYPISFQIEELKDMWGVGDKYKRKNDFIKNTVKVAKEELDACSPWTFEYTLSGPAESRKRGHPSPTTITFHPVHQKQFEPASFADDIVRSSPGAYNYYGLTRQQYDYMRTKFGFEDTELQKNYNLLRKFEKAGIDLTDILVNIDANASKTRPKNIRGYVINALKYEIEKENQ